MAELSMPVSLSIPTTYSECLQLGVYFVWYRYRKCKGDAKR